MRIFRFGLPDNEKNIRVKHEELIKAQRVHIEVPIKHCRNEM